jgi:hypothetical protein
MCLEHHVLYWWAELLYQETRHYCDEGSRFCCPVSWRFDLTATLQIPKCSNNTNWSLFLYLVDHWLYELLSSGYLHIRVSAVCIADADTKESSCLDCLSISCRVSISDVASWISCVAWSVCLALQMTLCGVKLSQEHFVCRNSKVFYFPPPPP